MSHPNRPERAPIGAGICDRCRHQQVVRTSRSVFSLCLRSRDDARFPKYPPIPVMRCTGYEASEEPDPTGCLDHSSA